jgi:hypothetical protein
MAGNFSIWVRISGEALNKTQFRSSVLTAMDDWVLDTALIWPLRSRLQFEQLQFHWG